MNTYQFSLGEGSVELTVDIDAETPLLAAQKLRQKLRRKVQNQASKISTHIDGTPAHLYIKYFDITTSDIQKTSTTEKAHLHSPLALARKLDSGWIEERDPTQSLENYFCDAYTLYAPLEISDGVFSGLGFEIAQACVFAAKNASTKKGQILVLSRELSHIKRELSGPINHLDNELIGGLS